MTGLSSNISEQQNGQKSSRVNPDCLMIDLKVPMGISFLGEGTITIRLSFRNLAWLPR